METLDEKNPAETTAQQNHEPKLTLQGSTNQQSSKRRRTTNSVTKIPTKRKTMKRKSGSSNPNIPLMATLRSITYLTHVFLIIKLKSKSLGKSPSKSGAPSTPRPS